MRCGEVEPVARIIRRERVGVIVSSGVGVKVIIAVGVVIFVALGGAVADGRAPARAGSMVGLTSTGSSRTGAGRVQAPASHVITTKVPSLCENLTG